MNRFHNILDFFQFVVFRFRLFKICTKGQVILVLESVYPWAACFISSILLVIFQRLLYFLQDLAILDARKMLELDETAQRLG